MSGPNQSTQDSTDLTGREPWAILISLMMPNVTMSLNASMVSVALPAIRSSFNAPVDRVAWIITIYTLPYVVLMPLYGRLADGLGKRRLFVGGLSVFLVGTAIALAATDLRVLMFGRAIQGMGSAGIVPLAIAMISELFPAHERGKMLGTWNSIAPIARTFGLLLAGFLIDWINWHAIFIPVLLTAVGAIFVVRGWMPSVRRDLRPDFLRAFDWGGAALLGAAMLALLLYISSESITGVAALRDWRLLTFTVLLFTGFAVWENNRTDPFVDLSIFGYRAFRQASLCAGVRMYGLGSIAFLIPLYLTDIHDLDAFGTGVMLLIHVASLLVTMRFGGQLADRWGSRWPVSFGLTIQVGAMVYFALLPGTVRVWMAIIGLVAHGLGAGFSLAALHRAAMGQIPTDNVGVAAGVYSMLRFIGTAVSAALGGVVLQQALNRAAQPVDAYHIAFWFAAGVVSLGVLVGSRIRM